MKHTPGPWRSVRAFINNNAPDRIIIQQDRLGGDNIADCGVFAKDRFADAYLISAAPEMLEVLTLLVTAIETDGEEMVMERVREAKKLLARIENS